MITVAAFTEPTSEQLASYSDQTKVLDLVPQPALFWGKVGSFLRSLVSVKSKFPMFINNNYAKGIDYALLMQAYVVIINFNCREM